MCGLTKKKLICLETITTKMGKSLMEIYEGDFMKVCEHYADVLGERKLPGKTRQQFIDWMYKSKDYSPSNYKTMFANPSLYFRLFRINKVINSGDEQHHMMCVSGKIGKGKTTFATQACALVDPSFNMSRVCYLPYQFFKAAQDAKPGQAILIDEGGNFFKALNTMGKMSKNLGQYFQMMRAKRLFIVICYDEYEKMMREIRDKMDSIYMKTPKKDEPAPRRYRYWVGWNQKGTDAVKDFLNAKKLPLTAPPLMRYAGIRGVHSAEFPVLNDVSEEAFKENKLNNVKEFEKLFLGEALKNFGLDEEHYQEEKKLEKTVQVERTTKQLMSFKKLKELIDISESTLKRLREKHPEIATKLNLHYRYDYNKILEVLS